MAIKKKASGGKPATGKKATVKKTVSSKRTVAKKTAAGKASTNKAAAKKAVSRKPTRTVTPEERWHMVSVAAYYQAEKRGFTGEDPAGDWLAAEAEIDSLLVKQNTVVKK